ncbi:Zinc finger protein 862-like 3 [Homarus americanus]|uniref:Zinc finger protein 862-like 3 n=1 Tax=Homarus americanus TaxID=6706 RepID=A0A8J5JRC2_HOMAM|nr:Zinc finger protein 862-like 3 [Homarus americanus]
MTSCKNGLVARLRSDLERPELGGIHCTANKLELAYKDAVKDVPLAKKVDLLLLGIYKIYENSSLNRSMLKRAREICQLPFLVPTLVGGTSWLPHMLQALQNLQKSYKAIGLHMQQDSSSKAKNYPMLLTSADIIKYIHLLLDILRCLGRLSEQFQHRQTNISAITNEIQASVDLLNKYLTSPGRFWKKKSGSLFHLVDLLLSIPISSADAECGFSQVKFIKTDWCSRLTDDHLTDLQVVQLQSECVSNFNPEQAINIFLTTGARRVDGYYTDGCSTEEVLDDIEELDEEHIQKPIDQIQ